MNTSRDSSHPMYLRYEKRCKQIVIFNKNVLFLMLTWTLNTVPIKT